MKHTTVICLLDKEYPPNHSFIDGMLSRVLPNAYYDVCLVVSKGKGQTNSAVSYGQARCHPILMKREGVRRFLNGLILYKFLSRYVGKILPPKRIVLFIRNEPVYLFVATFFGKRVERIIFQQSFPHEKGKITLKRFVARCLLFLSRRKVDGIVAVSPKGLKRLNHHFPKVASKIVIPLLTDHAEIISKSNLRYVKKDSCLKVIYIGAHSPARKLEIVLRGIKIAFAQQASLKCNFTFIGGNEDGINHLISEVGIDNLVRNGRISFVGWMPRSRLLGELVHYDVGLSLIPANDIYAEASPTKLVEYMSKGLMIIASNGIDLQEKFVTEARSGYLVNFDSESIAEAFIRVCENPEQVNQFKRSALEYVQNTLLYENYVEEFREML